MAASLLCRECGGITETDLDEFDDMPIADWWASKGERCSKCRIRAGRARQVRHRDVGPRPPVQARPVLPAVGTRRREVYDLLLALGARGAAAEDLARALSRPVWGVRVYVDHLVRLGVVEWVPAAAVWRVKTNFGGK